MIDMKKVFGHGLTRQDLEDMASPIMASELTDEQMQRIAVNADSGVKERYPEVADEMFRLWKKSNNGGRITEEELDFLDFECDRAEDLWWELVEKFAVAEGATYYEDIV